MYVIKNQNQNRKKRDTKMGHFVMYTSNWGMIIRNMYIVFSEKSGYFCKIKLYNPFKT